MMKDKLKVLFKRLGIIIGVLMCIVGLLGGVIAAFAAGKWFVALGVLALGAAAFPTCKNALGTLKGAQTEDEETDEETDTDAGEDEGESGDLGKELPYVGRAEDSGKDLDGESESTEKDSGLQEREDTIADVADPSLETEL